MATGLESFVHTVAWVVLVVYFLFFFVYRILKQERAETFFFKTKFYRIKVKISSKMLHFGLTLMP